MKKIAEKPSYELKPEHIKNARLVSNRLQMLHFLPKGVKVAEVGTREGHFSRHILDICQPSELHLIDRNFAKFERENFLTEIHSGIVKLYNRDSARGVREFPDGYFDWIYIDADHRYKGVARDIRAAELKVKEDGILVFNDYIHWTRRGDEYGVIRAVNELCLNKGWEVIYLALQKGGYNDIALRKMK